jgi:hypothetical protein
LENLNVEFVGEKKMANSFDQCNSDNCKLYEGFALALMAFSFLVFLWGSFRACHTKSAKERAVFSLAAFTSLLITGVTITAFAVDLNPYDVVNAGFQLGISLFLDITLLVFLAYSVAPMTRWIEILFLFAMLVYLAAPVMAFLFVYGILEVGLILYAAFIAFFAISMAFIIWFEVARLRGVARHNADVDRTLRNMGVVLFILFLAWNITADVNIAFFYYELNNPNQMPVNGLVNFFFFWLFLILILLAIIHYTPIVTWRDVIVVRRPSLITGILRRSQ